VIWSSSWDAGIARWGIGLTAGVLAAGRGSLDSQPLPHVMLVGLRRNRDCSEYALVSAAPHKEARQARCAVKELKAIPDS
jgi:hypothetical protein